MKHLARFSAALAAFAALSAFAQVGGPVIGQGGGAAGNASITGGTVDGAVIGGTTPAAGTFTTLTDTTALRNAAGTKTAPGATAGDTTIGWYTRSAGTVWGWASNGTEQFTLANATFQTSSPSLCFSGGDLSTTACDTSVGRDAANVMFVKNATSAQTFRVYFSTTGPVHLGITARTAGGVLTATGGAMQLSTAQTTVPTCTTNCGTSPSVAGTDTAMIVTLGTTPASAFQVNFNGTWPAAPSCVAAANTAGTTKAVTSVTTTTTTATVTTAAAPATGDKYNVICLGVS